MSLSFFYDVHHQGGGRWDVLPGYSPAHRHQQVISCRYNQQCWGAGISGRLRCRIQKGKKRMDKKNFLFSTFNTVNLNQEPKPDPVPTPQHWFQIVSFLNHWQHVLRPVLLFPNLIFFFSFGTFWRSFRLKQFFTSLTRIHTTAKMPVVLNLFGFK